MTLQDLDPFGVLDWDMPEPSKRQPTPSSPYHLTDKMVDDRYRFVARVKMKKVKPFDSKCIQSDVTSQVKRRNLSSTANAANLPRQRVSSDQGSNVSSDYILRRHSRQALLCAADSSLILKDENIKCAWRWWDVYVRGLRSGKEMDVGMGMFRTREGFSIS